MNLDTYYARIGESTVGMKVKEDKDVLKGFYMTKCGTF
jgi:hypothetical protein